MFSLPIAPAICRDLVVALGLPLDGADRITGALHKPAWQSTAAPPPADCRDNASQRVRLGFEQCTSAYLREAGAPAH
jgi:hypothetical protein